MAKDKDPPKTADKPVMSRARKQIEQQIELAEKKRRQEMQRRRIEIAERGLKSYNEKNLTEAAVAFRTYISVLEDLKDAPEGGLSPSHFDKKTEMAEMVLVAGIFWDLTKIFDLTNSSGAYKDFQKYLSKYVSFSKGMPYQKMCAETMRKHIRSKRAKHMREFKEAYKQIATSQCFIATELDDITAEATLPRLRNFRDAVLKNSKSGRNFVAWYYRHGEGMAQMVSRLPKVARVVVARFIDGLGLISAYSFRALQNKPNFRQQTSLPKK